MLHLPNFNKKTAEIVCVPTVVGIYLNMSHSLTSEKYMDTLLIYGEWHKIRNDENNMPLLGYVHFNLSLSTSLLQYKKLDANFGDIYLCRLSSRFLCDKIQMISVKNLCNYVSFSKYQAHSKVKSKKKEKRGGKTRQNSVRNFKLQYTIEYVYKKGYHVIIIHKCNQNMLTMNLPYKSIRAPIWSCKLGLLFHFKWDENEHFRLKLNTLNITQVF